MKWDVFICHASEDKESFARPLAQALGNRGLQVWYDDFTLRVGDKLRRSIDYGLANSRYGVVILSPNFFAKEWPQWELDGLVSRERSGQKVILPVWHNITAEQIRKYSPILADRIAVSSDRGIDHVVTQLLSAIHFPSNEGIAPPQIQEHYPESFRLTQASIIALISLAIAVLSCVAGWLALPQIQNFLFSASKPTQTVTATLTSTIARIISPTVTQPLISIIPRTPTFTPVPPTLTPTRTPTLPPLGPVAKGKIAFTSNRDGINQIYLMNTDGSGIQKLTNTKTHSQNPAFSPNGRFIAFNSLSEGPWKIFVVNSDGTNPHSLTNSPEDIYPAWSWDGNYIAFQSKRNGDWHEIYKMNADGSNPTRLTNTSKNNNWRPAWSPDGTRIAFQSDRDRNWNIYVMNAMDGSDPQRLTDHLADDESPSWSPDGTQIAFSSTRDGKRSIYIMNVVNRSVQRLTYADEDDLPVWSQDGRQITFQSSRSGRWQIYIIDRGGSNERNITSGNFDNARPVWSPQ